MSGLIFTMELDQLFERIAVATGRDHARAMTWFDGACDRAPAYADQTSRTLASTFHYALQMGWRPPRIEDSFEPDQEDALYRARRRLHQIFDDDDYERDEPFKKLSALPRAFATLACAPRSRPRSLFFLPAKAGARR